MDPDRKPFVMGVDPGRSGAYAILDKQGGLIGAGICPRNKVGSKWEENWAAMAALLRSCNPHLQAVYVEQTQAGPKMSKHATHVLAFNGGLWIGMAAACGIRAMLVRPQTWQKPAFKGFGERTGKSKQLAVIAAGRLWPELDDRLSVKANQGLADAALIAEYGRREVIGGY